MCIIIIKIDCLRALFTQKACECLGSLSLIKNCVFKLCAQAWRFDPAGSDGYTTEIQQSTWMTRNSSPVYVFGSQKNG